MQDPSDKCFRAKHSGHSPSQGRHWCLPTDALGAPSMAESWAGEDGEGMNKSFNEVESLDRLSQNRHSIERAFFKSVLLD